MTQGYKRYGGQHGASAVVKYIMADFTHAGSLGSIPGAHRYKNDSCPPPPTTRQNRCSNEFISQGSLHIFVSLHIMGK